MTADCKLAAAGNLTPGAVQAPAAIPVYASVNSRNVPFGHTLCFSRMLVVHSGLGDVIKKGTVTRFVGG